MAYLLSRDHALAEDLLQTALVRSWSAWRRIDGDPEPYVRRVLVNAYNSWWRRRSSTELASESLPDHGGPAPQSTVDARDEVWRALGRLPRQQRAVLVLRYLEDLSETEIADALRISPGSVKSYATRGLAGLRLDPTLRDLPVPPDDGERLTTVRKAIAQRRRRRAKAIAASCALVLASILGYAAAPLATGPGLFPGTGPAVIRQVGIPNKSGFPQRRDGYQLVAVAEGTFAQLGDARVSWFGRSTDVLFLASCAHGETGRTDVWLSVGARPYVETTCEDDGRVSGAAAGEVSGWVAGQPSSVPIYLGHWQRGGGYQEHPTNPDPLPTEGTFGVAVYERR